MFSFIVLHYLDPEAVNRLAGEVFDVCENAELLIVDNSGDFLLAENLSRNNIRILRPGYNSGFARGVNEGLRAGNGHFFVLLNQDISGLHNIVPLLEKQDPDTPEKRIDGVRLLSAEGSYQQCIWTDYPMLGKEWKSSTFYSLTGGKNNPSEQQRIIKKLHDRSGPVERLNGAFLLFHRSLVDTDGLFWDGDFFLYGEDVEWAWRCNRAGWRFRYHADLHLTHIGSASSPDVSVKNLQVILSDFLFVAKARSFFYTAFFLWFVAVGSRFDLWLLRRSLRKTGQMDRAMWANRKMKVYLTRRYTRRLLFGHTPNDLKKFHFNCYENDRTFAATLSDQG